VSGCGFGALLGIRITVKFQVFKDGKAAKEFDLCGAYLFGADSIPMRGNAQILFRDGMIDCRKKSLESAGLALLWPVEDFGKILLPTTRLPERSKPYNLNLEIARAKLMQITIKREDWSLFEGSTEHSKRLEEARESFIHALQNIADEGMAAKLADESLKKAVIFSESLTSAYADMLFNTRLKARGFSRYTIGCGVNLSLVGRPEYVAALGELVGHVSIPINWRNIEKEKGRYDFAAVDNGVEAVLKQKMAINAGPLLRFSKDCLPQWLLDENPGFEKVRELAFEFVSKTVTRYSKYIHTWRVISGIHGINHFGFGFEQILEMTRAAALAARTASAKSRKMIEIVQPWGEYYAGNPDTIPPLVYVDMVNQSGINFDAFGVEIIQGKNESGMYVRDLMHVSAMLDRFMPVSKPLHISAVAVPDRESPNTQNRRSDGVWRKSWDETIQAVWIEQFFKIALSKPFIETVTYANFADESSDGLVGSGLLNERLELKKSFRELRKMQKTILGK
jgi:hypothetical protein